MRQVSHPNLMKLEEVFESENSIYLIFQLLEGGQLYTKIKEQYRFKQGQIKQIMKSILSAVDELHKNGIMHRDIKPENILLRSKDSFECVIADFGLAEYESSFPFLYTRCGTPGYVAPEIMRMKNADEAYSHICDIFSIGVIFHILLLNRSVFRAKSHKSLVLENKNCSFDFEREQYQLLRPQTLDLLKKMLRECPQERLTAQQALAHPYFRMQEEQDLDFKIKDDFGEENFLDVAKNIQGFQDSCGKFKVNQNNVITGVDTIQAFENTKVSIFSKILKPGQISRLSKKSKFSRGT